MLEQLALDPVQVYPVGERTLITSLLLVSEKPLPQEVSRQVVKGGRVPHNLPWRDAGGFTLFCPLFFSHGTSRNVVALLL